MRKYNKFVDEIREKKVKGKSLEQIKMKSSVN